MAGGEDRHQLVAQFGVAHRLAVLVARGEQQREHVVGLTLAGVLGAAQGDLLVDEGVELGAGLEEARPGAPAAEAPAQRRQRGDQAEPPGEALDQPLEAVQPPLVVDAEDGAHDHRQGDPLRVRPQRERLADRPAVHLGERRLADQLSVALDPLAVEGRQQQLALAHVRRLVEGEDRVRAERRLEHRRVRLAGVRQLGRGGEELFDQRRVGDVGEVLVEGEGDAEDVAVAALEADQKAERVARVGEHLHGRGHPRAGRARRLRGRGGPLEGRLLHVSTI